MGETLSERKRIERLLEKYPTPTVYGQREMTPLTTIEGKPVDVEAAILEAEQLERERRETEAVEYGLSEEELEPKMVRMQRRPASEWKFEKVADDTLCKSRDIDVVIIDKETKLERISPGEPERDCVSVPNTRRCFERREPKIVDDGCERVKLIYACADETAGMLTPRQASEFSDVGRETAKRCIKDLQKENLLELAEIAAEKLAEEHKIVLMPEGISRWGGEDYYVMIKEKRDKIQNQYK